MSVFAVVCVCECVRVCERTFSVLLGESPSVNVVGLVSLGDLRQVGHAEAPQFLSDGALAL